MGHYGGSYKVTYDLYKKYGEMRLLDTPICGACSGQDTTVQLGDLPHGSAVPYCSWSWSPCFELVLQGIASGRASD